MDRLPPDRAATRTLAQHLDARDLRAVITDALAAKPVDEQMLRDGVWTYVRGEREIGVPPGVVILALTDMLERAKLASEVDRPAWTREVILWCVEAYFGQLGGVAVGRQRDPAGDAPGDAPGDESVDETTRTGR